MVVQTYETLFEELSKFEGLTENEVMVPSSKFTKDVGCMLVFFSIPAHQRYRKLMQKVEIFVVFVSISFKEVNFPIYMIQSLDVTS
ncbi:hypothetical protein PVK06_013241 [Gossypium arboreum]|uniref:Uncharacterized protein n=1 Tax=Gossypium arboreum TaxID=29729 RepID=A0ABR0QDN6_GOSAR|nr:hypothetical protein PVK06_013241 [Gossypium arboreum]